MEGVSKLAGAALVEAPFGWPHEKPQAVVALIKEARSHLQRGPATRLYLLLVGAEHQVSEKELEEVLAGYYAAAMEVDDELEVVVLPPFALHNYDPRTDLRDIAVLLTLAPVSVEAQVEVNAARSSKGLPALAFDQLETVTCTDQALQSLTQGFPTYKETVLGGTFDRLHAGHKIMLTIAVLSTEQKMVVGITGDEMLKNKKHGDVMQPYQQRASTTVDFLNAINPSVAYETIEINDPYGPTLTGPTFNAIIVSEETQKGAADINEKRKANGLQPLEVIVVQLVHAPPGLGEGKLSSTALREKYKKQHTGA
ncbi:cytidylyltransferase [Acanthamoeba castellanii str. Neff]|uniref:Cytidylyltransferase n=1 Tax=Acanthamoeba castellanii (strain ATCC 30010 / Neff) TaxID=1257118 RepID=L8GIJ5_ACACF|nr:cytidylyltransferase [Acanthamoeba castellanii str. Neff]ELR12654.1 cytidylyltransferase [Acanthamoeba castellanii str. Neff]